MFFSFFLLLASLSLSLSVVVQESLRELLSMHPDDLAAFQQGLPQRLYDCQTFILSKPADSGFSRECELLKFMWEYFTVSKSTFVANDVKAVKPRSRTIKIESLAPDVIYQSLFEDYMLKSRWSFTNRFC
jgi:hypothetical protein